MPLVCAEYRRKGGGNEPSQIVATCLWLNTEREKITELSQTELSLVWAKYTQVKKIKNEPCQIESLLVCAKYRQRRNRPSQAESLLVCAKYRQRTNRPTQIESPLVWIKKWAVPGSHHLSGLTTRR